jgi:hypothetical protein
MAMPRDRWGEAATGHRGVLRCQTGAQLDGSPSEARLAGFMAGSGGLGKLMQGVIARGVIK